MAHPSGNYLQHSGDLMKTASGQSTANRQATTPQRTLRSYGLPQDADTALVPANGILPACAPWALKPEERRLCLRHNYGLVHKVRIRAARQVHIVELRDTSLAISDRHFGRVGGVQVAPLPTRQGVFTHRVLTGAGWKKIHENAKTGEFTMGGRARQGPFWLTWNPTPPILTIMRAKGLAELLQQPVVPAMLTAATPRSLADATAPATVPVAPPATAPPNVHSKEARSFHLRRLEFLSKPEERDP